MKCYSRIVSRREPINSYGKLGYPKYVEYFITDFSGFVDEANKYKKTKFTECDYGDLFADIESEHIYSIKLSEVEERHGIIINNNDRNAE